MERHHIIPRHAGGTNNEKNITCLQHKEHVLAHHLLWKIHGNVNDKLAYCMLKGQITNPWKLPEFRNKMVNTVCCNLQKVDRKKQAQAASVVGRKAKKTKTGIFAKGQQEKAIQASKHWAKTHPELASKRSSNSHKNRIKQDYINMANTKSRHIIVAPNGEQYSSVAEAAFFVGVKRTNIDNWARRGTNGWSRI